MDERYHEFLLAGSRAGLRYTLAGPPHAPAGRSGSRLANRPGSSLEFMDHRAYRPGDDIRRIDWAAYGRTDRLVLKLYREEVLPHVDILIDGSRSMRLAGTAKAEATLGLAALVATAAESAGFARAAWLAAETWTAVPGSGGPPVAWDGLAFDYAGSPGDSFDRAPPVLRPHGLRVLLSDLLWVGDPEPLLARLADRAAAVVVVQVLAAEDADPAARGNARLVDAESGQIREVFVDAAARRTYAARLAEHQQHWNRAARRAGAVLVTVVAERVVRGWDLGDLVAAGILEASAR
jgi:uncharacterized protein (DUF58 family)